MEHIGMKLTEEHVRWAALGGSILGGGGGGSAKTGAEFVVHHVCCNARKKKVFVWLYAAGVGSFPFCPQSF